MPNRASRSPLFRLPSALRGPHQSPRSEASLRLELLVLRRQLRVLERQGKRPRWRSADRLTLAGFSRRLPRPTWFCFLVSPQTLLRWHCELVRRRWALFARRPRLGRPGLAAERGELILRLARENTRWGYRRIQGDCSSLACAAPTRTIRAVLRRHGVPPAPLRTRTSWRQFLRQHARQILATDFFTVSWHGGSPTASGRQTFVTSDREPLLTFGCGDSHHVPIRSS